MDHYLSAGKLQEYLKKHYALYRRAVTLRAAADSMIAKGETLPFPFTRPLPDLADRLSDQEYLALWDGICVKVSEDPSGFVRDASEDFIIPPSRDVFCMRHFHYLDNGGLHTHDFFEVNYVFRGSCTFRFREETRTLTEGQMVIIASGSLHDLTILEDSPVILTFLLRKSTFQTAFLDLLAQGNVISSFFRGIFSNEAQPNYLLFSTDNRDSLRSLIKNLTLEIWKDDEYSSSCSIHWIQILLTFVLRHFAHTAHFYNYRGNPDFALVLKYIQYHYRTLTLEELAGFFHYTVPYLSSLMKQNTGQSYTEFVREIRMKEARNYLEHTDLKISEIAESVGYHSADHFTRIFRQVHGQSPRDYRRQHRPGNLR